MQKKPLKPFVFMPRLLGWVEMVVGSNPVVLRHVRYNKLAREWTEKYALL